MEELAERLGVPIAYLQALNSKISYSYHPKILVKKGKERELLVPNQELKTAQRKILGKVLNFPFPNYVHGGVSERSILTNATVHLNQKWVMCLDIKNFFPSVHHEKIYHNFISLNCSHAVADALRHFTTYKYQLPQGAPTSPAVANMVLQNLDQRIFTLCKNQGFTYSRYFDDITISGSKNPKRLLVPCESIIKSQGLRVNKKPEKLRIVSSMEHQVVTGLLVNGKSLQIPPEKVTEIKESLVKISGGDFSLFQQIDPVKIKNMFAGYISFLKFVDPRIAKEIEGEFRVINWDSFVA